MESIVHPHHAQRIINPTHLQMKNVKGRLGKVLRTKLLFALNPEDKPHDTPPKKGAVSIQKDIEDIRIILYTVQEKDTISSVAEKFNVSTLDIIFANQLYHNQPLYIGQILYVYEDLTANTTNSENSTTNIPNSPPLTSIPPSPFSSTSTATTSSSSNTTPLSSPTITPLPPPLPSTSVATHEERVVSLFPSSDATVLDSMSSYRLLLPNLRVIYDSNLSKSAAVSGGSSAIQPQTILQLAMKLNSNEFLEEIKERVVYVSSRENQRAAGVLTATPRQIIFEPDWENPLMEQGLFNYRIQMSINDIIDCHMIMESAPPPLYEMELQFYDEEDSADLNAHKESYLQISVQSGVDPRVIRFIVPSEKLTALYQKIMGWTGRPIHASRVPAIPSLPLSSFSPSPSVPSSVPNSSRNSPIMRSTSGTLMSESSLFSAATSKLRTMYQPDLSVIKERVNYITKVAKVRGVLTLTSNMVIFEPDLDDPTVVQHGLIANQINFFMADIYDCVFNSPSTPTPSPPVSTSNPLDSPSWTIVDGSVSPEPRLVVTVRDGNGEKNVEFGTDKDKVDPIYAKISQHMAGRPKDKPRAQSVASSPSSLIPSPSPPSPTPFSLASSPAANLFSSLKNSNILSKFSIPSLSRSNSDLLPPQPIDMIDEITPQQRMIQEIEDYDIRLSALSNLINQERTKFLRRYLNSSLAFNDWKLLYSTEVHGISLNTMYSRTREKGPVFIVIQDTNRNVFGGYASESLHVSSRYYGTGESFLFKLAPTYSVYPWPNSNSFFVLTTENFISMGGGESGKYGFWVDADFQKGSSGFCNTFHNPPLSDKETFECLVLEVSLLILLLLLLLLFG